MARRGRAGGRVRASMVWLEVFAFASRAGESAAPSQRFGFRRIQPEGRGARHGGRSSALCEASAQAMRRPEKRPDMCPIFVRLSSPFRLAFGRGDSGSVHIKAPSVQKGRDLAEYVLRTRVV
jgi:hypothetical protein